MRLAAAIYVVALSLSASLFSVVSAIPLQTVRGNGVYPRKPHYHSRRISFVPPYGHGSEPSVSPTYLEQTRLFVKLLAVKFLNQQSYSQSHKWKLEDFDWVDEFELQKTTNLEFILDDDNVDAPCHPYCLVVVNIPPRPSQGTHAGPLKGTMVRNGQVWPKDVH